MPVPKNLISLPYLFEIGLIAILLGLFLWFILIFVPRHIEEIRAGKDD